MFSIRILRISVLRLAEVRRITQKVRRTIAQNAVVEVWMCKAVRYAVKAARFLALKMPQSN